MTRLILINVTGVDWVSLEDRLRSGSLTNLYRLAQNGILGWVKGAPRGEGLAAAASLATGLTPELHGVYRSQEAFPGGTRAISRASWKVAPIWARLEAAGIATGGVAWPASRPGASWGGIHIDEDFAEASGKTAATWALPLRCAPLETREALRDLRIHPTDVTAAMLAPFVPNLAQIDQSRATGLPGLAVALARAATIQAAAVWMLTERRPDAVFIHQPWLGQIRSQSEDAVRRSVDGMADGAWRLLDGLIGKLVTLAAPQAMVLVVSAGWRGKPGAILGVGPGLVRGGGFVGADILEVAPTVLAHFQLEAPELPGRPFSTLAPDAACVAAPNVASAPGAVADPTLIRVALAQGYSPPRLPPAAWRAQGLAELAFILEPRAPEQARDLAIASLERNPDNLLALIVAALSHVALEETESLPGIADALDRLAPTRGWGALARGAYHVLRKEVRQASPWLILAEADPDPDTLLRVAAAWIVAGRPMNAQRVFKAILSRDPTNASAEVGLSMTLLPRRDLIGAEAALNRALKLDPGRLTAYLQLARIYKQTGRRSQASQALAISIRLGATEIEIAQAS